MNKDKSDLEIEKLLKQKKEETEVLKKMLEKLNSGMNNNKKNINNKKK